MCLMHRKCLINGSFCPRYHLEGGDEPGDPMPHPAPLLSYTAVL